MKGEKKSPCSPLVTESVEPFGEDVTTESNAATIQDAMLLVKSQNAVILH